MSIDKSPRAGIETNRNNNTRNKLIGTAAAIAAGAGIYASLTTGETGEVSREDAHIEILANQIGLDVEKAKLLQALQHANEGLPAADDVPLSTVRLLSTGDVKAEAGDTRVELAIGQYEQFASLRDEKRNSEFVSQSVALTAKLAEQARRDRGESAVLQPGEEVGVTIVKDADGNDLVVVSGPVVITHSELSDQ